MENWKPYVVKVSVSVSVSIEGLVSVSVSVSIGGFFEYRYQSRYRLGALLSPGISPGIDSEAAKVSVSVSVPKFWYHRLSLVLTLSNSELYCNWDVSLQHSSHTVKHIFTFQASLNMAQHNIPMQRIDLVLGDWKCMNFFSWAPSQALFLNTFLIIRCKWIFR